MTYEAELRRAIRRLEGTEGRRIARRHALQSLDVLLGRIRREVRRKFPTISKTGELIVPKKLPSGKRRCPLCESYAATNKKLALHLVVKHRYRKCPCGFKSKFARQIELNNPPLISHLETLTAMPTTNPARRVVIKIADALAAHWDRMDLEHLSTSTVFGGIADLGTAPTKPQKFVFMNADDYVEMVTRKAIMEADRRWLEEKAGFAQR